MGQGVSKAGPGFHQQPFPSSAESSPSRSPEHASPARSFDEGPLSGLARRAHRASPSSGVVGFSAARVEQETTTQRGKTLQTSELDLCTGVAVGGVRREADGSIADSSVTVFHVLPGVRMPGVPVVRQVNQLRSGGFEVNAYVAGADRTADSSRQQRSAMEGLLKDLDVPYDAGPLSDGRGSQILSAAIQEDGEIQYRNSHGNS